MDNDELRLREQEIELIKYKIEQNKEKIKDYILFLENNEEFITEYVPIGDRISISRRRYQ